MASHPSARGLDAEVAVVMGSDSDFEVMKLAIETLRDFDVKCHVQVLSAHRTPHDMLDFATNANDNGFKIIIAGAGGAAHLPGMIASATTVPVIGVPVKAKSLEGLDSLLSIVQMPSGVPVATVGINNAKNAALLALRILGISNRSISQSIKKYQEELAVTSRAKTLPNL